ncbi:MAG: hypothetical protein ABL977_05700, partial [Candidatus Eisenbacteria bacterium]
LLVQGEYLQQDRDNADWDGINAVYTRERTKRSGGYLFADYNWKQRYNVGASVESYDDPDSPGDTFTGFGAFAGLALMEETTAFRLDWKRTSRSESAAPSVPADDPIQSLTLRVIFSMGPHKAHQF